MKRFISVAALLATVACGSALAGGKPTGNPGHGNGTPPVTNPGKDIIITLPDTSAPDHANFHSPVLNVPEPEAVAMALAGLGVVGVAVARRRKK